MTWIFALPSQRVMEMMWVGIPPLPSGYYMNIWQSFNSSCELPLSKPLNGLQGRLTAEFYFAEISLVGLILGGFDLVHCPEVKAGKDRRWFDP